MSNRAYSGRTHVGKVRKQNEDAFFVGAWPDSSGIIAVVADGMGSYGGGADAARLVVQSFAALLVAPLPSQRAERYELLLSAFYDADESIRRAQDAARPEMGATAAACIVATNEVLHLHAGDCRLYHFDAAGHAYVTHDHSVVQSLIDSGLIAPGDAKFHPMRSIVTSCIGGPSQSLALTVDPLFDLPEAGPFRVAEEGDFLVLCSDGFWGEVSAERQFQILRQCASKQGSADTAVDRLLDAALAGPATDNVTVIAIDVDAALSDLTCDSSGQTTAAESPPL